MFSSFPGGSPSFFSRNSPPTGSVAGFTLTSPTDFPLGKPDLKGGVIFFNTT